MENSPALFWPLGLTDGRLHVRRWLMAGGDLDGTTDQGLPVWASAMAAGHPEAVDELLEAGACLEARDTFGNGWLHWCINTGQSVVLTMMGMARLGPGWWHPNTQGQTPFHLPTMPLAIAQAMGARYWAERRSWRLLLEGGDPAQISAAAGSKSLALTWRKWEAQCKA